MLPSLTVELDGIRGTTFLSEVEFWVPFLAVLDYETAVLGRALTTDYDLVLFISTPNGNESLIMHLPAP